MRDYSQIDLEFSYDGDFTIGASGDLGDTADNTLQSFIQEAQTRLRSELYDWTMHPHLGAAMSDLLGEPNDKETAEEGQVKIISALTKDGFCNADAISVHYMPVSRHHILYKISIRLPFARGELEDNVLTFSLLFDSNGETDGITFL